MENCTAYVLKTPIRTHRLELQQPDQVGHLRQIFEQKLIDTKRRAEMEELEKLRSQSTSIMRSYGTRPIEEEQTHRSKDIKLPFLMENKDSLIKQLRDRIDNALGQSPTKTLSQSRRKIVEIPSATLPKQIYDVLVGLKVKPPEPKAKFYEIIETPPFNRGQRQDVMVHFMKDYKFLRIHPEEILENISSRVTYEKGPILPARSIWIVENGQLVCKGRTYKVGEIVNPQLLENGIFQYATEYRMQQECRVMAIPKFDYQTFLAVYLSNNLQSFTNTVKNSPTLRFITKNTIQKIIDNLTLKFMNAGECIFQVGDKIDHVYIIHSGSAFRKVIVQLDKYVKIPITHSQTLIKTFSNSHEFKIIFRPGEMLGFNEIINKEQLRNEEIQTMEDCILLCISASAFEDLLDDHTIERLKDEKNKKYPTNYDKLCHKFSSEKEQFKRMEQIKIEALQQNCRYGTKDDIEKKSQRISRFVSRSMQKIKDYERMTLIKTKKSQKVVKNLIQ